MPSDDVPREPVLRYTEAATVGQEHARATWALAAREKLVETAGVYHAVVTAKELSEFVQRRSLIRTNQMMQGWIGDVLSRVAADCVRRREPLLTALCVDAKGKVGNSYVTAVEVHRGGTVTDPDQHAAEERLDCYRHFGADLPPGGGEPALPPQAATTRARTTTAAPRSPRTPRTKVAAAAKPVEQPLVTCPVHFTVLPASGVCDLCD